MDKNNPINTAKYKASGTGSNKAVIMPAINGKKSLKKGTWWMISFSIF